MLLPTEPWKRSEALPAAVSVGSVTLENCRVFAPSRTVQTELMRVVLQRVKQAHVEVAGESKGRIGPGLLILLGVTHADGRADADYLADKILHLRIFPDDQRRMNRSVLEAGGALLVVSQFTLYGSCKKGRRPSFDQAAPPEQARELYEYFVGRLQLSNTKIETGVFQAEMEVYLVNDGPVTFVLDSARNSEL